ncbi:hypothetical protein POTOM_055398 [Populus tomentosa]|uniref:Uncharacterized protein n=1 Tax=Populus tomentosa TaxID=118781 RepID=A0A8X7Y484_POPTO|nr:hypothetical protein POTOM_055398 [Populus tomentosa]
MVQGDKVACCGTGPYGGSKCGLNKFELCDNASEYLFFDGIHPADEVHNQFAKLLRSGNPDVGGPFNLKTRFEE